MRLAVLASSLLLLSFQPVETWRETDWSRHLAAQMGGEAEYRLPDASRVDILTADTAWECEWPDHWPQSIGQAEFYAISTGKRPGVILLMRGEADKLHYLRCLAVTTKLGIELRTVDVRKGVEL